MNKWAVISYYTKKTPYQRLEKPFQVSTRTAGITQGVHVYPVANRRNWHLNTHYKALILKEALVNFEHIYDALVFVDIDAKFRQYPGAFDLIKQDFAAHFRNWQHARDELLSGTLFLRINDRSRELVDDWIALNKQNPRIWEQKNLQRALKRHPTITTFKLPIEYCMIFDDERKKEKDVVIEHFQASRRFRREVEK